MKIKIWHGSGENTRIEEEINRWLEGAGETISVENWLQSESQFGFTITAIYHEMGTLT